MVMPETHQKIRRKLYNSWRAMKERCDNQKNKRYSSYGGRGISYDYKWDSFSGFYADMGDSYIEGYTLDRIDVDGDYNKQNCRWATNTEQCYNQRKRKDNTTGKPGVGFHKKNQKWTAYISINRKQIYLGSFDNFLDAVSARNIAEIDYYGYLKIKDGND
jgi:hypothetical protein